ncbi:hypothetical protein ACOMHN_037263 [Nucella lapillus]
MIRSPSLRTRTNLFLCHLAVADLSVGLVCIVPNMVLAANIFHWFPGPFYNFFEEFSLTASVLLLVLIAAERYVAIIYPLKARQLFTRCRMYTSLMAVWTAAALYNVPLLMIYETATIADGHTYCYRYDTDQQPIRMDVYHVSTFLLTYVLPLLLMASMYLRMSLTLWRSSPGSMLQVTDRQGGAVKDTGKAPQTPALDSKRSEQEAKTKGASATTTTTADIACSTTRKSTGLMSTVPHNYSGGYTLPSLHTGRMRDGVYSVRFAAAAAAAASSSAASCRYQVTAHRVLQSRRKVIRLLVAVLVVFACCVLPFHLRLLLRYGLHVYFVHHPRGLIKFVSQLLFFLNSALNPVLYSLMSHSFRRSARQVLCCDSRSLRH